ncbi:Putative uncharacterized protein [Pseudomonas aeruginosa]|nr:Putative uncharacterized protein [Pseudomonas aeruginosa]
MAFREDRVQRRDQQQRHPYVEHPQPARIAQHVAQHAAETGPDSDGRRVDQGKYRRDHHHVGEVALQRRIGAYGADRHHPGLRVDPLERRRAPVAQRLATSLRVVAGRAGRGDLPGQVQQVRRADVAQDGVQHRIGLEHRAQAEAHRHHHDEEAATDPEDVRDGADETEVDPRGQQHGVVRTGRDGGDEGEQGERQQQIHGERHSFHPLKWVRARRYSALPPRQRNSCRESCRNTPPVRRPSVALPSASP